MSINNKNINECYWYMVGFVILLGIWLIVVDSFEVWDIYGCCYFIGLGFFFWGEGIFFS